jgi:LysM repeat protein
VSGRSPARLLAPVALAATFVALFVVLAGGDGGEDEAPVGSGGAGSTATTPASSTSTKKPAEKKRAKRYTVKAGDTPSSIAEDAGIPLDKLLELNPDIDPQQLSPGQKLKLGP